VAFLFEDRDMDLKMKIIAMVGLSRFSPRWLKVLCLQVTMSRIEKAFRKVFAEDVLSKITDEQRNEINAMIAKMNTARGRG